MRTFREFITLCEQTYDKEMGQTVKKIGTGVKVGAERKKTAPERRRMKGGAKTPTASQLLTKKTKPKVSPDYKPQKASGLTRDERRKVKRAGQRLVKDMQKGRERPRSAYEPGMSIAMRK